MIRNLHEVENKVNKGGIDSQEEVSKIREELRKEEEREIRAVGLYLRDVVKAKLDMPSKKMYRMLKMKKNKNLSPS